MVGGLKYLLPLMLFSSGVSCCGHLYDAVTISEGDFPLNEQSPLNIEELNLDGNLKVAMSFSFAISTFALLKEGKMRVREFLERGLSYRKVVDSELLTNIIGFYYSERNSSDLGMNSPYYNAIYYALKAAYDISARKDLNSNGLINSAIYSARAFDAEDEDWFVHNVAVKLLPVILRYKICDETNQTGFGNSDKVFELLSHEDKELFLFNLDSLR